MLQLSEVAAQFERRFAREPEWVVVAPGRVNLIGEHTDYNDGFVLPMAIDRHTMIAAARRNGARQAIVRATSLDLDDDDEFAAVGGNLESTGRWTDYVKGVLAEFVERGFQAESLDLLVSSNVPMGCGLSSSAALQVATASLLRELDAGVVRESEIPALCQSAEHRFAGVPVGIMDQFCIANARKGHVLYLDCRSLQAEYIPFDDPDTAILIVDSRVTRALRGGAYAERRAQCDAACRILGVDKLRDANAAALKSARAALGDVCYRRARHVTTEDLRTTAAAAAIRAHDWCRFGGLMYDSHDSLRDDFEVSCREMDILVDLARRIGTPGGVLGARMTGGGFGGCIVALVEKVKADNIIEALTTGYRDATGRMLSAHLSRPARGARVLQRHERESP